MAEARAVFESELGQLPQLAGFTSAFERVLQIGHTDGVDTALSVIESHVNDLALERAGTTAILERLALATGRCLRVPGAVEAFEAEYKRTQRAPLRVRQDPAFVEIRDRARAAAAGSPGRAFLLLHPRFVPPDDSPVHHPLVQIGREASEAARAVQTYLRADRGEAQARALRFAIEVTTESVYKSLLKALWQLEHGATRGDAMPPNDLGRLVDDLNTTFPSLASHNAKVLRKAVAHGHWIYRYKQDRIEYWNVTRRNEVQHRRTVSVDALGRWCCRVFHISTTLISAVRTDALTEIMVDAGLLRASFEAFVELPTVNAETNRRRLDAVIARAFGSPISPPQ